MSRVARSGQPRGLARQTEFVREIGATSFGWSLAKLRVAALALLGAATPAALAMPFSGPVARWFCLAWLLGAAVLMHALNRRCAADTTVLSIDRQGIWDRRLMARCIAWDEIAAVCPVDLERGKIVDLELRRPDITLAQAPWRVRIGAHCQSGFGVPAVTISMLLVDGTVSELLDAVALYRPELLRRANWS